jgi:hypothetical protein
MRIALMVGAFAALTLIGVQPGAAVYEGPWCARVGIGEGAYVDRCDMRSFEMCLAEIRGMGASHCSQNPYYRGLAEAPRRRKPQRLQ